MKKIVWTGNSRERGLFKKRMEYEYLEMELGSMKLFWSTKEPETSETRIGSNEDSINLQVAFDLAQKVIIENINPSLDRVLSLVEMNSRGTIASFCAKSLFYKSLDVIISCVPSSELRENMRTQESYQSAALFHALHMVCEHGQANEFFALISEYLKSKNNEQN